MVRIIRRKFLFIVGVLITGLLGSINSYVRTNYSKDDSLLTQRAHADTPAACGWCGCPYTADQCTSYWTCFPSGTFISTPSGDKDIQDIVEGDVVYGFNIETGVSGEYPVTRTFKHGKGDVDGIYSPLVNITHERGSLMVTENHWIYRRNGRIGEYANFDKAGTLQVGDMLTIENGEEVAITLIEKGPEYDFVYNLEVGDVHTYFADGVRVHNSGAGGCCGSSGK